ncbi:MAG: hypothetical protein J6V78_02525 [Clostridia bacterium]|nr:hypothetical protein [Clostridia bacterium]
MYNMLLQAVAKAGIMQGLEFTTENLSESLICSIAGMAGIFIVVGIIILSTTLLNKFSAKADKKDKE